MPTDALKTHFRDQFAYTRWANRLMIDALGEPGEVPEAAPSERALLLMSHLLRAQDVWLGRIQGRADLPAIWECDSLAACRARAETSADAWRDFLQSTAPAAFGEPVHYENSKGTPYSNVLREICGHVVNHSTHHRAQIARLLRATGIAPPVTDYIFYARS